MQENMADGALTTKTMALYLNDDYFIIFWEYFFFFAGWSGIARWETSVHSIAAPDQSRANITRCAFDLDRSFLSAKISDSSVLGVSRADL